MRLLSFLIAAVCVSFLQYPCALAQTPGEPGSDVQSAPVRQHHDKHHGHDHIYPDRGAIYHELPRGAVAVHHAGLSYKFFDGVWFEPRGQAFIVVAPAIGAVVTELPALSPRSKTAAKPTSTQTTSSIGRGPTLAVTRW
jgi:hypothetical protein